MESKTSHKITYCYLLLSVMILGQHSVYMELFNTNDLALTVNHAVRIFSNMAVPAFFFLSAILFYRNCESKRYVDVIKKKIKTLVVPYLCWNVICWPLKEYKNILTGGGVSSTNLFEVINKIIMSQWDPVLWFVRVLFFIILIYPVILWLVKNKRIFICFVLLNLSLNIYLGPTTGYSSVRYWLPIYMIGAYLSHWYGQQVLAPRTVTGGIKGYLLLALVQILLIIFAMYSDLGLYVCRMVSPICFWGLTDMFAINSKPLWWMKQSFYYYSAQMIFSGVAQKIYTTIFGIEYFSAILANFVLPLILLTILIMTAYGLRFVCRPAWKILTGGR